MAAKTKTKAQLVIELAALQHRVAELETELRQREVELEHWLAAERENWALSEALNQTGAAIGSSLRGEEVLDRILEEMSRVVACDAACLLLVEEDMARVYRWRGYIRPERAMPGEIVSAALSITRIPVLHTVRQTSRPRIVSDPPANDAWVHKFGTIWVKSYACAPIRSRGRVVGFLTVDSETPGFFEPADAEPLQTFADQAAMALDNVGHYDLVRGEMVKRLKTLKKERNFITAVLDTADALVMALNRRGQIVHFNRACEQISGYTFAEIKNRYLWELLPAETAPVAQNSFAELSRLHRGSKQFGQLPAKFEWELVTKTGQKHLIAWSNAALYDRNGEIEYIIATGIDITEQRQAEAALKASEARYRSVIAALAEGIVLQQSDGQIVACNASAERILGLSAAQMIGRTSFDPRWRAIHEDGSPFPGETHPAMVALRTGQPQANVIMGVHKPNGLQAWISINAQPLFLETETTPYAVVASFTDITERKQAEEALQENEALLRATIEQVTVGINYADMDGRFFQVNDRFCQMLGYSRSELLTKSVADVTHPDDMDTDMAYLRQMAAGELNSYLIEKRYIRKDGGYVWVNLSVSLVHVPTSKLKYAVAVIEDITERKQMEEELRRNHNFLQTLMDNLPVSVFVKAAEDGRFVLWNKASEKLFGITAQKALGRTDSDFYPKEQADFFRQKDAEVFAKRIRIDIPEEPVDSLSLGRRLLHTVKMPFFDEHDNPLYLFGISEDITERQQAEEALRTQNEQLQARNRELDAFARTVAHDLKNPLGVLTPMAEILAEDYHQIPPEKLGEYLETIARTGRRANRIVEALLLLAGVRQKSVRVEPLDMAAIIAESLQRLESMITKYQAEIIIPDTWPVVLGYGLWVEEIWVNYLSNGLKYGGQPPRLELGATLQPDDMGRFWVHDNGPGLTPEAQAQLFAEFTQLEPDRIEGHGLGLSIVRRIVEKLGGQVGVESEGKPGQGSLFSFTLPLANR